MGGTTQEYFASANANTLVCLMLEEVVAISNIAEIVKVKGVDVLFIGSGDLSQCLLARNTFPQLFRKAVFGQHPDI